MRTWGWWSGHWGWPATARAASFHSGEEGGEGREGKPNRIQRARREPRGLIRRQLSPGGGVGDCCWHFGWNNPLLGFPGDLVLKNPPANAGDEGDKGSIPGSGRFPWRREWQLTLVFLPGKSHRGAWQAAVHGVTKSRTQLNDSTQARCILECMFKVNLIYGDDTIS